MTYMALDSEASMSTNPFEWWASHAHTLPLISTVARWLLGIPGSNAGLERFFSRAGKVAGPRRPRLQRHTAAGILQANYNVANGLGLGTDKT